MSGRALTLTDVVTPIWILHHRELLLVGNQGIDKNFSSFVVNIIIARSVDNQELACQTSRVRHRRAGAIVCFVVLRQTHVTLLIDRVIEVLVGNRRHRHSDLINVRIMEYLVEGHITTAYSTP